MNTRVDVDHTVKAEPSKTTRWLVLATVASGWLLGFGARAAWQAESAGDPGSTFEGQPLLATADAYYYASGVQHEVLGTLAANPRTPGVGDNLLVALGSALVWLTGAEIEAVCLWLPALLAPLVAVPLVLLGLLLGELVWGWLASLVAVLGFSYWNRSVPGYFDTDVVAIPFLFGVAALIIVAFWRRDARPGAVGALLAAVAPWVHPGSESLLGVFALGALGYTLLFLRGERFALRVALMLLVALLPLPLWLRIALITVLELGLTRWQVPIWSLLAAIGATLALILLTSEAMAFVFRAIGLRAERSKPLVPGLSFPGLAGGVTELAGLTLARLGERVAGHIALLATGVVGYLLACWRYRPLLLLGPLLAFGLWFGAAAQRYTIFAVPVVALGNAWWAVLVGRLARRWGPPAIARLVLPALASIPMLASAITYAASVTPSAALIAPEAEMLRDLGRVARPGDFLITWWDYAYGAWYYAGVNTIIDGTKQSADTWIVAELLLSPSQREAAALARLAAENQANEPPLQMVVDEMITGWTTQSGRPMSEFVPALREGTVALPTPTRQVFLYLPWRVLDIAPQIAMSRPVKGLVPEAERAALPQVVVESSDPSASRDTGWTYDAKGQQVIGPLGQRYSLFKVADVGLDKKGRVRSREAVVQPDGQLCVVNLQHSRLRVIMNRVAYHSVLTQLLLFATPDPAYFAVVAYAPGGAIYKVVP